MKGQCPAQFGENILTVDFRLENFFFNCNSLL
jgi:hypothetical protein